MSYQNIQRALASANLDEARRLIYLWLQEWSKPIRSIPRLPIDRDAALLKCVADVIERTHDDFLAESFWQVVDTLIPNHPAPGKIPLLGIPILNRFDLLEKLLSSIDYPVQTLALVDNSSVTPAGSDLGIQLRGIKHHLIGSIEVARPFRNLGVAASWNHILLSYPEASWSILVNNDVQFTPGALESAASSIQYSRPQFIPFFEGHNRFSAFALTAKAWDLIGLFDANFFPAYCEDLDYLDRLRSSAGIEWVSLPRTCSAMESANTSHSHTIQSDTRLAERNQFSFQLNRIWYFSRRRLKGDPRGTWARRWLASWD